jgi:hypothetical protein
MWTAIGYDWSRPAEQVVELFLSQAANGAIFCLHDGRRTRSKPDISSTVQALATLVPMLLDRGFYFESLAGMMRRSNAAERRLEARSISG